MPKNGLKPGLPVLALDASTDRLSLALAAKGRVFAWEGPGGAQASSQALPRIRALLTEAGQSLDDLGGVVLGRGPGSFTGVRTACALAQGLAAGAQRGEGCPVVPICSLLSVAEAVRCPRNATNVIAILDARMNECYAAWYAWDGSDWQERRAPCLVSPEDARLAEPGWLLAGNVFDAYGARLPAQAGRRAAQHPSAQALLALGLPLLAAGRGLPAQQALPLYVRDKVAQTTAEREASSGKPD